MHLQKFVSLLAGSACLAAAAPAAVADTTASELRLIKTSPEDPGVWVTEEQKFTEYTAKGKHFIDITDITDPEVLAALSTPDSEAPIAARAVTYPTRASKQSVANPLISQISNANQQSWLRSLTNFHNRHYRSSYGTQSSDWLFNTVKSVAAANPAITVTKFTHSYNQPSIIAKIPGNTTDLVIAGAHFDSTAGSTSARAPGAEDNGSGTIVVLEALRVLANAKFTPKNTLEFHFYSGEEGGLLGSAAVFSNYKSARKSVLAFLNQDMAGYSPSGKLTIYTDYVDSSLSNYVKVIATAYVAAPATSSCGYGCSDHASARSNGFPAAYVGDEKMATSANFIHSAQDTYDKVQWNTVTRHTNFTLAFLVEASYL
ncbi:hypothetical protein VTJ83DRAFT_797 [Remersonia thermophila]|uniref:Peptide hydrolase n=1 Tax=Remersonia thermophila TaxID=72144 RepID=A0ABR4DLZ9_9PEZI